MLNLIVILGVVAIVCHVWLAVHATRERRRIDRFLIECTECGYPIASLDTPVCPECGAFFPDPMAD